MVGISRAANLTNDAGTCYRFQVRCHLVEKIAGSLAWVSEQPAGRHSSTIGFASIPPPPPTHSLTHAHLGRDRLYAYKEFRDRAARDY